MGPVQGNHMIVNVTGRVLRNDGKITIVLDRRLDQNHDFPVNRFENGTYTDLNTGLQYQIVGNANNYRVGNNVVRYLILNPRADGRLPSAQGRARIVDDDRLGDGDDVPMPDTRQLELALREAFVRPIIRQDNGNVTFAVNASRFANIKYSTQLKDIYDWDDASKNSPEHWAVYLLGAFQPRPAWDNDPRNESFEVLGVYDQWNRGETTIFWETIRDATPEWNIRFQNELPQQLNP